MDTKTTLLVWFVSGILSFFFAYAMSFAYAQKEFISISEEMKKENMGWSLFVALLTLGFPFILFVVFLLTGFAKHGLKWR